MIAKTAHEEDSILANILARYAYLRRQLRTYILTEMKIAYCAERGSMPQQSEQFHAYRALRVSSVQVLIEEVKMGKHLPVGDGTTVTIVVMRASTVV
jgi:hypothetical protein